MHIVDSQGHLWGALVPPSWEGERNDLALEAADLTRVPCTYYECIALFTEHLPWLKGGWRLPHA
jgi:hypothetical protein